MLVAAGASSARGAVLFENAGNTDGWGRVYTQKGGTITVVSSPAYKGTTAFKTSQTYMTSDGANYHSEVVKNTAQLAEQDLYYGQVIYLPARLAVPQPERHLPAVGARGPGRPWILMFVQNDKLQVGGRGINGLPVLATITTCAAPGSA
jgi:hypothetical protein